MCNFTFPVIDSQVTGEQLKVLCKKHGLTAKRIQECLCLGSPQTVYDWFQGRTLPSLENMVALSELLDCSVEELLVFKQGGKKKIHRRKRLVYAPPQPDAAPAEVKGQSDVAVTAQSDSEAAAPEEQPQE